MWYRSRFRRTASESRQLPPNRKMEAIFRGTLFTTPECVEKKTMSMKEDLYLHLLANRQRAAKHI